MLELVSSDSLNVPSEEDVYRAVLSWVKHDVDARRQHVPRVRPAPGVPYVPGQAVAEGWRGHCRGGSGTCPQKGPACRWLGV